MANKIDLGFGDNNTDVKEIVENTSYVAPTDSATNVVEEEEIMDPNKIVVEIGDKKSPIVLLFGPRSSGKTMTLIRLARYLRGQGYKIFLDPNFRPGESYRKMCDDFDSKIGEDMAQKGTAMTDFMLLKVVKNGRTICQFLEAPGEHYFDQNNITVQNFPPYISNINNLGNQKVWVFITEPNWRVDANIKTRYVERIRNCKTQIMSGKDKSIILYNKMDTASHLLYGKALVHTEQAIESVDNEYPGIFDIFRNNNPITSLWRTYNCKFAPFSTGQYSPTNDGGQLYTPSSDEWPSRLWNQILSCIKG